MSRVYFISDLHLGHAGALVWSRQWREGKDIHEAAQIAMDKINSVVTKRDTLYILGDVSWKENFLFYLHQLPCTLILVRGNHDDRGTAEYMAYFKEIYGIIKYKGFWLSHAPIHPHELRKYKNIHGHTHQHSIITGDFDSGTMSDNGASPEVIKHLWDKRYISVCVEAYNGYPVPMQDIIDQSYWNKKVI